MIKHWLCPAILPWPSLAPGAERRVSMKPPAPRSSSAKRCAHVLEPRCGKTPAPQSQRGNGPVAQWPALNFLHGCARRGPGGAAGRPRRNIRAQPCRACRGRHGPAKKILNFPLGGLTSGRIWKNTFQPGAKAFSGIFLHARRVCAASGRARRTKHVQGSGCRTGSFFQ